MDLDMLISENSFKSQSFLMKNQVSIKTPIRRSNACLNMETAHKMINQFLIEKKITKEELAQLIGITLKDFEKLNSVYEYNQVSPSASYKLLCLYCRTEWDIYEITKRAYCAAK